MTYVKGSERRFRGLRGFDRRGPRSPFSGLLDDLQKAEAEKLQKEIASGLAKANALAKIQQLATDPNYGPVFAEAVKGTLDPDKVAARAKALANSFSTDKVVQNAYRLAYSQGRALLTELDEYLSLNPYVKNVRDAIDLGIGTYAQAQTIISRMQRVGVDGSGVQDSLKLAGTALQGIAALADSLGANSGVVKMLQETAESTLLFAGCAKGLGDVSGKSTGNAVGAFMGCAASMLQKAFSLLSQPSAPAIPRDLQRAIFVPSQDQLTIISLDAVRLAHVLRFYYGVNSYAELYWKLNGSDSTGAQLGVVWTLTDGFPTKGSTATGLTMGDILSTMRLKSYDWSHALPANKTPGELVGKPTWYGPASAVYFHLGENVFLGRTYGAGGDSSLAWGDVNESVISGVARWARTLGTALFSATNVTYTFDYNYSNGVATYDTFNYPGFQLEPFLYVDELLSFFAAVTRYEVDAYAGTKAVENAYGAYTYPNPLPVRLYHVAEGYFAKTITLYQTPDKPYDKTRWTLSPTCLPLANNLRSAAESGSQCALRELAAIRLMSAFSYMHLLYKWSNRDLIKEVVNPGALGSELRVPVNPRSTLYAGKWITPTINELYRKVAAREKVIATITAKALADAEADQSAFRNVVLAVGAGGQTPTMTGKDTVNIRVDPNATAVKIGMSQLQYTPPWLKSGSSSSGGGGGGGVALVGGAALLALLLLKR